MLLGQRRAGRAAPADPHPFPPVPARYRRRRAAHGASSILVEFGPIGCDISIGYVSDGTDNAPQGVRGGLNGAPARQFRVTRNGETEKLPGCAQVDILDGEGVRSFSSGGGGYGPPTERAPGAVAKDVREGWVSAERARTIYRVALDHAGDMDMAATAALRR
jgi:N-methylhydantoinase B